MKDTQLALQEVNGPLTAFLQKLGGKNGREWLRAFNLFLRKENPWPEAKVMPLADILVWKTIELGTGPKTGEEFCNQLETAGRRVSDGARYILCQPTFPVASEKIGLGLVMLSLRELGFSRGARLEKIYNRGYSFGLELCPAEIGPWLSLHRQAKGGSGQFFIAMNPIIVLDGACELFSVHGGNLSVSYGNSGYFYGSSSYFVFVKPRK